MRNDKINNKIDFVFVCMCVCGREIFYSDWNTRPCQINVFLISNLKLSNKKTKTKCVCIDLALNSGIQPILLNTTTNRFFLLILSIWSMTAAFINFSNTYEPTRNGIKGNSKMEIKYKKKRFQSVHHFSLRFDQIIKINYFHSFSIQQNKTKKK